MPEGKERDHSESPGHSDIGRRAMDAAILAIVEKVAVEDSSFKLAITTQMNALNLKMELMLQQNMHFIQAQENHHKLLYGKPEELGKGGLIALTQKNADDMNQLKQDVEKELSKIKLVWGSITFVAGFVWTWLADKIWHGPGH